ncbi:hypothetical protein [Pseudoflavitalea rhizosphaerae]|uniref:hypothetical protein n=1 Tax=Pseudoflavitalea rhizosphaerae TaxID=1884793 RepID=UPI000F8D678C|nr:hypothetical protein [Pseudoflavitalea rhizosphaerae]
MEAIVGFAANMPPRVEEVRIYFSQKGIEEAEANTFFLFYEKKQWKSKTGNFLKNWKSAAYQWVVSVWKEKPWLFDKTIH